MYLAGITNAVGIDKLSRHKTLCQQNPPQHCHYPSNLGFTNKTIPTSGLTNQAQHVISSLTTCCPVSLHVEPKEGSYVVRFEPAQVWESMLT